MVRKRTTTARENWKQTKICQRKRFLKKQRDEEVLVRNGERRGEGMLRVLGSDKRESQSPAQRGINGGYGITGTKMGDWGPPHIRD